MHYKKNSNATIRAAIAAVITGGIAVPALAQNQQEPGVQLEEITVTGSRITQTSGFASPVPVTAVSTEELSDFDPGNTISAQLDALPQFFDTRTPQNASPGGGSSITGSPTAALNLRALGNNRTLVLLDGSRMVPTDKQGTVNADLFPSALVRSVDVVTGGASAAYGADAVGGVVNFVLDREFEGFEINAGFGQHAHNNTGKSERIEIAGGTSFMDGRLHVIGSAQSREIDEVPADPSRVDNFDWWGHVRNPEWSPGAPAGTPQRLTRPQTLSTRTSPMGLIRGTGTALDNMRFTPDGSEIVPFQFGEFACQFGPGCLGSMSGGPEFQFREQGFGRTAGPKGRGAVARSGFLGLQYDVNDRLQVHWQGMVGRTESLTEKNLRFYPILTILWFPTVFRENAFLPDEVAQIMDENGLESFPVHKSGSLDGFNDAGAKERSRDVFTNWNWRIGVDYTIPGVEWDFQASWQRGESKRNSQIYDMLRYDRYFLAADAVTHPETGEIVCNVQVHDPGVMELAASVEGRVSSRPVNPFIPPGTSEGIIGEDVAAGNTQPLEAPIGLDDTIKDCVPFNVMGSGNMSREALDYIHTHRFSRGFVDQDFAEALLSGELYQGWGPGPVNFALGLTWRDQQFIDGALPVEVDKLGPPINVPELGIRGFPRGVEGGSPNLHALSTVPNIAGQTDVWEWFAELSVPVFETQALFGQVQRLGASLAYRESDYDRSGSSNSWKVGLDFQVLNDLRLRLTRSKDVREPTFFELFDAQGNVGSATDPRFGNESFTFTQVEGGNPILSPETANTNNVGVVWQPAFADWITGLQLSLDWYEVDLSDTVDLLGVQRIVNECELNGTLCGQIERDAQTGEITRVFNTFQNIAQAGVEGWDVEAVYRAEPDFFGNRFESFNFRWLAGFIKERTNTPAGGLTQDTSDTQNIPDLTSVVTTSYGVGPWSFQIQGRYIDSVKQNLNWVEGVDVDDNTMPSMIWWNTKLAYNGELNNGSTYAVHFNVQNIFDRDPPIDPGVTDFGGGTQGFGGPYDIFGRRYSLDFNYAF